MSNSGVAQVNDARSHYTRTAVVLHWLMAVLIIAAFIMGEKMTDMAISPLKVRMYNWHKWLGVTVLAFVALRLLWRLKNPAPAMVPMPAWQRYAAHGLHIWLYFVMFALPLSGWIYSNAVGYPIVYLGMLPLPTLVAKSKELATVWLQVHEVLGRLLFLTFILHVLAALKHQFVDKDGTLMRMLAWRG